MVQISLVRRVLRKPVGGWVDVCNADGDAHPTFHTYHFLPFPAEMLCLLPMMVWQHLLQAALQLVQRLLRLQYQHVSRAG